MTSLTRHYIDGTWSDADDSSLGELRSPANSQLTGHVQLGDHADVDRAVAAARRAFETYSTTTLDERLDLLRAIAAEMRRRGEDLAEAVTTDMGIPIERSRMANGAALHAFETLIEQLPTYDFEERKSRFAVLKEPIGVCGLIPPWNYPALQMSEKVAPAIAVGCTVVLKPAEITSHSARVFAEIIHAAGTPAGVVNIVNGLGSVVGSALSAHPDVDMISFTGSTAVGIQVQKDAADTVKRVTQELGGKSAHIVLPGADLEEAVRTAVGGVMGNSGQTCAAPTRTIVHSDDYDRLVELVRDAVDALAVGDPFSGVDLGPVASEKQWQTVQRYIRIGIEEGARVISGGVGRPDGTSDHGWFVRPTVFADVSNDMTIAREEIFGPVMSIIRYETIDEAVEIANDSPYGLTAFIQGTDQRIMRDVAVRLRAGQIVMNATYTDLDAPFGGYKKSGNGRTWGITSVEEFLETKALVGAF